MVQCTVACGGGPWLRLVGTRRVAQAVYSGAVAGCTTHDRRGGGASGADSGSNKDGPAHGRAGFRARPGAEITAPADARKSWAAGTSGFGKGTRYVSGGRNRDLRSPSLISPSEVSVPNFSLISP